MEEEKRKVGSISFLSYLFFAVNEKEKKEGNC